MFISFLVILGESLLQSVEVYSDMIAVQLDDVNRSLVRGDVLTFIVRQESFGDFMDQFHKGYNSKLLFFTRSMSPSSMTRNFNFF